MALPQRSNMLLTAGFSLPGFDGRLRAFRAFKPVADSTKATGWKFVKDGTRLWPDLDDRPMLAGMARTPASSDFAEHLYVHSGQQWSGRRNWSRFRPPTARRSARTSAVPTRRR